MSLHGRAAQPDRGDPLAGVAHRLTQPTLLTNDPRTGTALSSLATTFWCAHDANSRLHDVVTHAHLCGPVCGVDGAYCAQVDEDLRVWLLEVNTNPYLGAQNSWHAALLPAMVRAPSLPSPPR